jgi:predicted transcriptional regulator
MATTKRAATFRLSDETHARISQIAEMREGLSATRVIENAVEQYHRALFGRRSADLVPPRARPGRSGRTMPG